MGRRGRIVLLAAVLASAPAAAACTGGGDSGGTPSSPAAKAAGGPSATRWWSNSAATAGSAIDPANPLAAAAKLHESTTDYCGMLRQTVAAGRAILPGVAAGDPALLASTRAFVGELERVAPPAVAGSWRVLGDAVVTVVRSGGDLAKAHGLDRAAVQQAATTVAAHARRTCRVDVGRARS